MTKMLLTPTGKPAGKTDRIMLLAIWARYLREKMQRGQELKCPPIITAGLGRPTFPVNEYAAKAAQNYWSALWSKSQEARHLLNGDSFGIKNQNDKIAKMEAVINYGDPKGDEDARLKMAEALTRWYNDRVTIKADDVLFIVGGVAGLHIVSKVINGKFPNGVILTPFPHYSLYTGAHGENNLYPIPVMQEKGYRLTAKLFAASLEKAISSAKQNNTVVSAFLLCDPNNPLGTTIDQKELQKIAEILRNYPDIFIILDEAYAEMRLYDNNCLSLLTIAPDLKDRIILIRSATKALSAAGERMAVIVTFNASLMGSLLEENINIYGHAPRSLQHAFAEAMDKLDAIELAQLNRYYREQTEYVAKRLTTMGAAMPDPNYRVTGTFYVVGDFSDLIGLDLPEETARALNKRGKIQTDEDIAYYLLFNDGVMIAPLSYFGPYMRGLPDQSAYMRITCSGGPEELKTLMDRLENRLVVARKIKQSNFESVIGLILKDILIANKKVEHDIIADRLKKILTYQANPNNITAARLKESNFQLKELLSDTQQVFAKLFPDKVVAATKIQSWWRGLQARKETRQWYFHLESEWQTFVNQVASDSGEVQKFLLALPVSKRAELIQWKKHLQQIQPPERERDFSVPRSKL